MHISLPFPFTVIYGANGNRNTRQMAAVGSVDADMPAPSERDVTMVARYDVKATANEPRYSECCIAYAGNLFVEVRTGDKRTVAQLPRHKGELILEFSVIKDILGNRFLSSEERSALMSAMESKAPNLKMKGVEYSNFSRQKAVAKECIDSLLFFRGCVWKRVPWIRLELSPSNGGFMLSVAKGKIGYDTESGLNQYSGRLSKQFGLDDLDRVLTHANGCEVNRRFENLEVVGPLPSFDARRHFELGWAAHVARALAPYIGELDADAVNDWLFLRDQLSENGDLQPKENISDALTRTVPLIRIEALRTSGEKGLEALSAFDAEEARASEGLPRLSFPSF